MPPVRPQRKKINTQKYFTISNCIFNFNILALVVSKILEGPKFTYGSLRPLDDPQLKKFHALSDYFIISNCIFNFNVLAFAVLLSEILGWSQIYIRGSYAPPRRPMTEKF